MYARMHIFVFVSEYMDVMCGCKQQFEFVCRACMTVKAYMAVHPFAPHLLVDGNVIEILVERYLQPSVCTRTRSVLLFFLMQR